MTGVTTDLLTGIAARLAGAGLGLSWASTGIYASGQTGIFMKLMPAAPDRAVVLASVNQGDNITLPSGQSMVQIRARGQRNNPLDPDDILDGIFANLHGTTDLTYGTAHVIQCNRRVRVPMGMDESDRWEVIDQYYLDVDAPPTVNRPAGGSW